MDHLADVLATEVAEAIRDTVGRDPQCRFARWDLSHVCRRRDGRIVRSGVEPCHLEAHAQTRTGATR